MTPYSVEPGVLEAPESEHSRLGPSSAERWIECPASVRATAGIADEGSSFAIEGTAAHAVAEACEANGVRGEHYLGWTVRVRRGDKHTDVECGQEMVDGVNMFLEYVDEFPGESLNESRVDYPLIIEGGFGTMDRAKIEPDGKRVHVFDLKYGKGVPVDATDNPQLKLYALGMDHTFGWMSEETEQYVVHVVQPRLDNISSWAVSREELLQWGGEVAARQARKAVDGNGEFKAGKWCTFCKIKATCMVRASSVFSEVVGDFAGRVVACRRPRRGHQRSRNPRPGVRSHARPGGAHPARLTADQVVVLGPRGVRGRRDRTRPQGRRLETGRGPGEPQVGKARAGGR